MMHFDNENQCSCDLQILSGSECDRVCVLRPARMRLSLPFGYRTACSPAPPPVSLGFLHGSGKLSFDLTTLPTIS